MTKRAASAAGEVAEVEKKLKKEEPKDDSPSLREKLAELTKEELIEKLVSLTADYDSARSKQRKAEEAEHIARIRYTLKDKEHRNIAQDRCNARWKLLGDAAGLIKERRGLQMEAFVHDTLISQRDEIYGLKKDLEGARSELSTLRGKAGEEHSKEWERVKKLKEENDRLRGDAKKKAEVEKQLAVSQKANTIYKAKFKEMDKELHERASRIRQLEEAPRAEEGEGGEEEEVEEELMLEMGEEKDDEPVKEEEEGEGAEAVEGEEEETEELMLDEGIEEEAKAEE